ncbi:MAG: HNH endonuclease, partial [Duodenibacillus sp.]|nr:HNH endonuclease [Duodenibacillus sp.]
KQEILRGWAESHLIHYLQQRNPGVPGIPDKLAPPAKRDIADVDRLWKAALAVDPGLREIYSGASLDGARIEIDHFVPWSYVASDELWNLHPTLKAINSSKGNRLPDWDPYFGRLADIEWRLYALSQRHGALEGMFARCRDKHVFSREARDGLYRRGIGREDFACALERLVRPLHQSAANCGFGRWAWAPDAQARP